MAAQSMPARLSGLIPAAVTPMGADGSIHLTMVDRLVEHYVALGSDGLFVNGTTGESVSLSTDERMRLAQRWCEVVRSAALPVGVNVTHTSLPDCRAMATHATKIGAAAFSVMAPYYFKPKGIDDLVAFCAEVAGAAPGLPFYYYHYPRLTGVTLNVADLFARALDRIPNLAGFKYSSENLIDVGNTLDLSTEARPITAFYGFEAMMLGALAIGVSDFIGGSFNFNLPTFRRLKQAIERGDLATARIEQARGRAIVTPMRRHDFPAATKVVMKLLGIDCGPVRLPMRNLSETDVAELRNVLERGGLLQTT
jgi:N-acetylneuraminate lyase